MYLEAVAEAGRITNNSEEMRLFRSALQQKAQKRVEKEKQMKIDLDNGKYTYIFEENTGKQYALRYDEEWRDLTGDNLVAAMAHKIEELENRIKILVDMYIYG